MQPVITIGMRRQQVHVLGDRRLLAVWNTVLPQVALTEVRRHDAQIAAAIDLCLLARRRTAAKTAATTAGEIARQRSAARHAWIGPAVRRGESASHAGTFPYCA